jgi:hypothetical protein
MRIVDRALACPQDLRFKKWYTLKGVPTIKKTLKFLYVELGGWSRNF